MKTRLTFLPFADSEQFADSDGFIEMDFNTKQEAFDYMCFYAEQIECADIIAHGQSCVDSYNCDYGFLADLIKKHEQF